MLSINQVKLKKKLSGLTIRGGTRNFYSLKMEIGTS
jgi:hypothetical protein